MPFLFLNHQSKSEYKVTLSPNVRLFLVGSITPFSSSNALNWRTVFLLDVALDPDKMAIFPCSTVKLPCITVVANAAGRLVGLFAAFPEL